MPIISGGGSGGLPGVTVSGAAAASKALIATSSSAASWAYPPGFEIGYAQVTSQTNVTDTSEATATSLISPGALTFDGGAVYCEFFTPQLAPPSPLGASITVTLFEGATEITRLAFANNNVAGTQIATSCSARYKFTPTAASHTYKLCAFVSSTTGTPYILGGTGSGAAYSPAYIRFVKV